MFVILISSVGGSVAQGLILLLAMLKVRNAAVTRPGPEGAPKRDTQRIEDVETKTCCALPLVAD
jgi:hypothetical protein